MSAFSFTEDHLIQIRDHPHILGHMCGMTKLTELHSKWIKDVWIHGIPIQAHRGSYKTTSITAVGPVWWLLFHPNDRIAIFRKPYEEAAITLAETKKFFEMEEIIALFIYAHDGFIPNMVVKKEKVLTFNFKKTVTKEGSINAYGIENVRTGTHFEKAICDDFVTLDDRLSKAKRERTKQGVLELITNIMDPGQRAGFTGTPWHKDDAWTLVPEPERYCNDDFHIKTEKERKYIKGFTHIKTREEMEYLESITTPSLYACNHLLKHIASKDAIFTDPVYGKWDRTLHKVYGHLDAKYRGDHTNGLTFMALREDGFIQAVGYTSPEHIDDWQPEVEKYYQRYHAKRLYNEDNADKGYLAKELRGRSMNVESYTEKMNKHVKIVSYLKKYWNKIIWAEETQPEYLVQITDYLEGQEPDDCPDSAASLLRLGFYKGADDMALWRP